VVIDTINAWENALNSLIRSTGTAKVRTGAIHAVADGRAARAIAMLKPWAARGRTRGACSIIPTPFTLPVFAIKLFWHARFHRAPGNRWLSRLIAELMSERGTAPTEGERTE
jgi:DNA-binding transcriptional LysR family regulator